MLSATAHSGRSQQAKTKYCGSKELSGSVAAKSGAIYDMMKLEHRKCMRQVAEKENNKVQEI